MACDVEKGRGDKSERLQRSEKERKTVSETGGKMEHGGGGDMRVQIK